MVAGSNPIVMFLVCLFAAWGGLFGPAERPAANASDVKTEHPAAQSDVFFIPLYEDQALPYRWQAAAAEGVEWLGEGIIALESGAAAGSACAYRVFALRVEAPCRITFVCRALNGTEDKASYTFYCAPQEDGTVCVTQQKADETKGRENL